MGSLRMHVTIPTTNAFLWFFVFSFRFTPFLPCSISTSFRDS